MQKIVETSNFAIYENDQRDATV